MRRGAWFQLGAASQRQTSQQLQHNVGVGVILSVRDLSYGNARKYALEYRHLGADLLVDQQFYVPEFHNDNADTYPLSDYRASVSQLNQISDNDLEGLTERLRYTASNLQATGILAPAVPYEADRPENAVLNKRLFFAARQAADELNIPACATVILGRSVTATHRTLHRALSDATSVDADGWYFGFEPNLDQWPLPVDDIFRYLDAGITLALTGKPVLHAFTGPMGLLSPAVGATGIAIGHSQNLWRFPRERWLTQEGRQGGGGDAPPRLFSDQLWGKIVYQDEIVQLPVDLRQEVFTPSPFAPPTILDPLPPWNRWDANGHLVFVVASRVEQLLRDNSEPKYAADMARSILLDATALHSRIAETGLFLSDSNPQELKNWITALDRIVEERKRDYEYLSLLI